jgi:maleate isomerase
MRAIGLIVPSCNRVVERITAAVLADLAGVSAHSTRVKAQEYTLDDVRRAAELLADARVDAICWSATEGVALGFDSDVRLSAASTRRPARRP